MDRNSIMAFALSMLVFTGWAMWQAQRHPPSEQGVEQARPLVEDRRDLPLEGPSRTDLHRQPAARTGESGLRATAAADESQRLADALPGEPVVEPWSRVFELPLYRVEVTNHGAGFLSWTLLDERYTERLPDGERAFEVLALEAPYDVALRTPLTELRLGDLGKKVAQTLQNSSARIKGKGDLQRAIQSVADKNTYGAILALEHEIAETPFLLGEVDLFQQSFAQMFLAYFERVKLNRLRHLDESEGRHSQIRALTEEEFIQKHAAEVRNLDV